MIEEIELALESAIDTATDGTPLAGSDKFLGNIIGNALQGVYNGLSNLFSGASQGSGISGSSLTTNAETLRTGIPTLSNVQIQRANELLDSYGDVITTLGTIADIDKATKNINTIIKSNEKIQPILKTLAEIKSFGKYSIVATGFTTWKFVSINSTNGSSSDKDSTSQIEAWFINIMQGLSDLGYLNFYTKKINPINIAVWGGNAAGVVITGIQDDTWITQFIKSLNDIYGQFDNLIDYVEGEVQAAIIAMNSAVVTLAPGATTTEEKSVVDWDSLTETMIQFILRLFNITLTDTNLANDDEEEEKTKKKKRRKKLKSKKKKSKKNPKMIKSISMKTPTSNWIESITFVFPVKKPIKSNDRGTMTFHLKKGGSISKVRVKRGTFSVIALWSNGTNFGVGYRYWSQFNKKNIVNKRKVFSWFIPLINPEDRKIAIPMELKEKVIKYK